ncbi:chitin deacetylase [Mortierella sp. AD032]|nr:chitin deacetylase [Mortierella sp. AD032]
MKPSNMCILAALAAIVTITPITAVLDSKEFPPESEVPSVDSPLVKQWLSEIDLTAAPSIPPNSGDPSDCSTVVSEGICRWACEDCSADDVIQCPDVNAWGLTFNAGPSEATPELLAFLGEKQVKATFFVLAEIKWTEKAIADAVGYRVRYMRPPYGDIDNRVRFVLKALGYTVVNWSGNTFDSNDWKIPEMSISAVVSKFQKSLQTYTAPGSSNTKGFISLEHDLSKETVAVAKEVIPFGMERNLMPMTVAECLHDTSPYSSL